MALETTPYDTADYLDTPEAAAYYLEGELEENEPRYMARAIATVARARGGFDRLAAETGIAEDRLRLSAAMEETLDRRTVEKIVSAFRQVVSSAPKVA